MAKKKKYTIGSVALSTIGTALVAMILTSMLIFSIGSVLTATAWVVVIQILSLLVYMAMIYSPSWYCGDHDSNSVQFGHMQEDRLKGLKIGLLAMIPFALTPVLLVLIKLGVLGNTLFGVVFRILNIPFLYAVNALIPPEASVAAASWGAIAGVWLFYLIIPITTLIAYSLGFRHISIMERLVFKNLPKNANKKKS